MPGNSIRSAILSGEGIRTPSPIAKKKPKHGQPAEPGSLAGIGIRREESRHIDQRRDDRHSHLVESGSLIVRGEEFEVAIVNASPGGAMIEREALDVEIGEPVELKVADCDATPCVVRWIRGPRIGVEFGDETAILGPRSVQNFIVRSLRGEAEAGGGGDVKGTRTIRHRLIWLGEIHCDNESTPARVRNISAEGAMVECDWDFHIGTELLLDLEEAGTVFGIVRWCRDGQIGLRFSTRFDLKALAKSTPAPVKAPPPDPPSAAIPIPGFDGSKQPAPSPGKLSLVQIAELYGKGTTMR